MKNLSEIFDLNVEVSLSDELFDSTVNLDNGSYIEVNGEYYENSESGSQFILIDAVVTYDQLLKFLNHKKIFSKISYVNLIPNKHGAYQHERNLSKGLMSYMKY